MKFSHFLLIPFLGFSQQLIAQVKTAEDSLAGDGNKPLTYLGGYGNAFYQYNSNEEAGEVNLERVVIFLGHRFNEKFSFHSEIEIEDAKVSGGEEGGEVATEQAYLKFKTSRNSYLIAGLFIPRIGIINENHLPNTFNGNERPLVERYVIPSTWRELGVGFYSRLNAIPMEISLAVMNGLNSEAFEHGNLLRGGRYEGREASANNLAFTGSVQYSSNNFTFQISGYAGGSVASTDAYTDSIGLKSGILGTPVILGEANIQYSNGGFSLRALGTLVTIPDAEKINSAFGNNTPESAIGFYGEIAYDLLHKSGSENVKSLNAFVRYENFNLNSSIPSNGIEDKTLEQQHIIAGITYLPIPQIAVKADIRLSSTGNANPLLYSPGLPAYEKSNSFFNLGFGFSF